MSHMASSVFSCCSIDRTPSFLVIWFFYIILYIMTHKMSFFSGEALLSLETLMFLIVLFTNFFQCVLSCRANSIFKKGPTNRIFFKIWAVLSGKFWFSFVRHSKFILPVTLVIRNGCGTSLDLRLHGDFRLGTRRREVTWCFPFVFISL